MAHQQRLKNQGRRDRKNDIYRLRRTISPDLPQETVETLETLLSWRFFPAFPKAISGVYSLQNRSGGFSNSPRQPEANVCLCRGTEARSPPRLSEPGQSQWMSAITEAMIPIDR